MHSAILHFSLSSGNIFMRRNLRTLKRTKNVSDKKLTMYLILPT